MSKSGKVKVLPLIAAGLAVVLVGIVVYDLVGPGFRGAREWEQERVERIHKVWDRMREEGSVKVTIHADLRTVLDTERLAWFGTGVIRFGERDLSHLTFTEIKMEGKPSIQAEMVVEGDDRYVRTPYLTPADGRPWMKTNKTGSEWPVQFADPGLQFPDFTKWFNYLQYMSREAAASSYGPNVDLTDLDGAPNEYRVDCREGRFPGCPGKLGMPLDLYFNSVQSNYYNLWLDDDGVPRQVDVQTDVFHSRNKPAHPAFIGTPDIDVPFELRARYTFSDFGTDEQVTVPPADQVTRETSVRPAG